MADGKHARQLRAALSYRHKVKRLGRENDEARSDGRIDEERHAALRSFYNAHGLRAEAAIAKVRNLLHHEQTQLRARNAAYEQERDALSVRAAAGEVQASSARQRHRKLTQDIERIRARLEQLETLLTAHEPMALGGFIDMPLDEYDVEPPETPSRGALAVRWATAVIALATSCIVFLPWFGADGGRWALPMFPQFLATEFPGNSHGLFVRNAWIIAFALPLVSCPFAAMSRSRVGGQGTATIGAVVVVVAILLTLIGSAAMVGPSMIGFLEPAYFAYLFGALALTFMGTARMGIPASGKVNVRQLAPSMICIAITLFLCIAGVTSGAAGGRLLAQVDSSDVDRGVVRLYFGSEGQSAHTVHVPWPPNIDSTLDRRALRSRFGVNVFLLRSGESEYQFLADSSPYWELAGAASEGNALTVEPGTRTQAAFDLRRMRSAGIEADALRFEITSGRGDLYESVDVQLPSDFRPEPRPQPVAAEAEPVEPDPVAQPEPAPMPVAPSVVQEPPAEPEPPAETFIQFSGLYGAGDDSSAILNVSDAVGSERVTVRPGETIIGAWYLDRIESRPSRAVIRHRGTNEEREIYRREYTTIAEEDL